MKLWAFWLDFKKLGIYYALFYKSKKKKQSKKTRSDISDCILLNQRVLLSGIQWGSYSSMTWSYMPYFCLSPTRISNWHTLSSSPKNHQSRSSVLGASLVAQWLRTCLLMQETRVRALVWEDPTCRGATRPVSHNYWACASGARAPQQERPQQWEARAPRWRVAPARRN